MSKRYLQELIKSLQELYTCPSCDSHYHFEDIKVLGQIDQYAFIQLGCHSCSMPFLTMVTVGKQPAKKTPTDLRGRESSKFNQKGLISALEIAEFHRFISNEIGPLGKLTK